ncbi:hypothetical protein HDU84_006940 [Entophlyctis sp. JEL0112]|nr:hypothetical protein HDU84_006940 [Entophlyctis sp. JEL0112]
MPNSSSDSDSDFDADTEAHQQPESSVRPQLSAGVAYTPQIPRWSRVLRLVQNHSLTGDRILLPSDALGELLSASGPEHLPSPLFFRLFAPATGAIAHGSVREFTARDDSTFEVSPFLAERLFSAVSDFDLSPEESGMFNCTVECTGLPKCDFVKLAPLDPGYLEIPDLRALLESHLRQNYASISEGSTLTIPVRTKGKQLDFKFLITETRPEKACSCIDVDVNLDIAPLDFALAKEAVERKLFGENKSTGGASSDAICEISVVDVEQASMQGIVSPSRYSFYKFRRLQERSYRIELVPAESSDCDLFVSVTSSVDRPTIDDHDFYDVSFGKSVVELPARESSHPSDEQFVYISVRGYDSSNKFTLSITSIKGNPPQNQISTTPSSQNELGYVQCENCLQHVPVATSMMHDAFCRRNNVVCGRCKGASQKAFVFSKSDYAQHWHCDDCDYIGSGGEADRAKHLALEHSPRVCQQCEAEISRLGFLAKHVRSECPERLIECRFCHLFVRAGKKSMLAKDLILGLDFGEHESECGSRTIDCIKCKRKVQLKDVQSHFRVNNGEGVTFKSVFSHLDFIQIHEIQKDSQKTPPLCPNSECSNAPNTQYPNILGLCQSCFRPFWSPSHDPGNARLAKRLIAAYNTQLTTGCGQRHCANVAHCATAACAADDTQWKQLDPTGAAVEALNLIKKSALFGSSRPEYFLCVADVKCAARKVAARRLGQMGFHVSWCVKALEEKKCDLLKPECTRCAKQGFECSYAAAPATRMNSTSESTTPLLAPVDTSHLSTSPPFSPPASLRACGDDDGDSLASPMSAVTPAGGAFFMQSASPHAHLDHAGYHDMMPFAFSDPLSVAAAAAAIWPVDSLLLPAAWGKTVSAPRQASVMDILLNTWDRPLLA